MFGFDFFQSNPKDVVADEIGDIFDKDESKDDLLNLSDTKNFDIAAYLKDDHPYQVSEQNSRKFRAGVKKIDMKAQRYILDEEDDIDVETVSDCDDSSPIMEAGDLTSLLEQFEASEIPDLTLPDEFLEPGSHQVKIDAPTRIKINETQDNLLESCIECKPVVKIKQLGENKPLVIKQESCIDEISITNSNSIKPEQIYFDNKIQNIKTEEVQKYRDVKIKQEPPELREDTDVKHEQIEGIKNYRIYLKRNK